MFGLQPIFRASVERSNSEPAMSFKAIYIEGVFKPLGEVRGAVPGKTYWVFSEDELRDLNEELRMAETR
jgi:hypothetical protein